MSRGEDCSAGPERADGEARRRPARHRRRCVHKRTSRRRRGGWLAVRNHHGPDDRGPIMDGLRVRSVRGAGWAGFRRGRFQMEEVIGIWQRGGLFKGDPEWGRAGRLRQAGWLFGARQGFPQSRPGGRMALDEFPRRLFDRRLMQPCVLARAIALAVHHAVEPQEPPAAIGARVHPKVWTPFRSSIGGIRQNLENASAARLTFFAGGLAGSGGGTNDSSRACRWKVKST